MNTSDEISLHQILQIFTKRWKYLIVLALIFTLGALSKHKYFPSYPGSGKLIIKDVRNSQLQSLIGHAARLGATEGQGAELKGDDPVERSVAFLDIHEFYVATASRLLKLRDEEKNLALMHFFGEFKRSQNNSEFVHDVANRLSQIISFNTQKSDILEINAKSNNRELTVILVNETLLEAKDNLIERELDDLNRAEAYFRLEIDGVRGRLDRIENSTVRKMQKNQVFSVDSEKGESSKYMGELKKNINDTKIALSNNESKIANLKSKIDVSAIKDNGVISKFNESSQIRLLEDENKDLTRELTTYQSYLKNFETQKSGLVPFQYELEKMNASHEFEYKMYASLNDSLARLGLQKTYVKNKIEILEVERLSRVHSSPPLLIMILIALTISQVFGIFSIYVYELFKPTSAKV